MAASSSFGRRSASRELAAHHGNVRANTTEAVDNSGQNRITTFPDLLQEVTRNEANLARTRIHAADLRFEAGRLAAGDLSFSIPESAFPAVCASAGAPAKYLQALPPKTAASLLAGHFERGDQVRALDARKLLGRAQGDLGAVAVISEHGRFLALARPDLAIVGGGEVLRAIERGVRDVIGDAEEFAVRNAMVCRERFSVDFVLPSRAAEAAPGDVVEAGLHVVHSLVGAAATRVETYFHRLACGNEALHRACSATDAHGTLRVRRGHRGGHGPADVLQSLRQFAAILTRGLDGKLKSLTNLRSQQVDDAERFFQVQLRSVPRLYSKPLHDAVWKAYQEDSVGAGTAYGIFNALTFVGTHVALPDSVRGSLLRLSGALATHAEHRCSRCLPVLKTA